MTMGVDLAELPGDALSLLDAVDEGRLEASAQEVLAWNRRSPMFAQALRDLLFAHELWRETRERFEAANREASAAADRPITVAALSRCPGFRPAARRRRPRAVHLAIAALVLVAFAVFLRGPCTSPPRKLLGTEIAIDPRSFAPELDGALLWSDAALAEGDAFRVRLKRGVQILELARGRRHGMAARAAAGPFRGLRDPGPAARRLPPGDRVLRLVRPAETRRALRLAVHAPSTVRRRHGPRCGVPSPSSRPHARPLVVGLLVLGLASSAFLLIREFRGAVPVPGDPAPVEATAAEASPRAASVGEAPHDPREALSGSTPDGIAASAEPSSSLDAAPMRARVRGVVVDARRVPVQGARVGRLEQQDLPAGLALGLPRALRESTRGEVATDEAGRFELALPWNSVTSS